jgi:hypothetical protein
MQGGLIASFHFARIRLCYVSAKHIQKSGEPLTESFWVTRRVSRSIEMKTRLLFVSGALLIAISGSALAQESQQEPQQQAQQQARPTGQAGVLHDANTSAQATSDTSYGGTPDARTAAGNATSSMSRPRQCVGGSVQCDVFFGH